MPKQIFLISPTYQDRKRGQLLLLSFLECPDMVLMTNGDILLNTEKTEEELNNKLEVARSSILKSFGLSPKPHGVLDIRDIRTYIAHEDLPRVSSWEDANACKQLKQQCAMEKDLNTLLQTLEGSRETPSFREIMNEPIE